MKKLATALDRIGYITKRPPFWAATATVMAVGGGQQGRRAALRGSVGYATAAVIANLLIKPFAQRPRPPQAGKGRIGPLTSSFPSGHTATDLAFVFSAAQELPGLFVPLAAGTATGHWSIVRTGSHYISDVFAGGLVGITVAWALRKVWPPHSPRRALRASAPLEAALAGFLSAHRQDDEDKKSYAVPRLHSERVAPGGADRAARRVPTVHE